MTIPASIQDIDDMLEQEFKITEAPEPEEETDTDIDFNGEEPEIDENEDENQPEVTETEETETEETELKPQKPDKSEKEAYAFKNLREENDLLKNEKLKLEQDARLLQELALQNGYTDVEAFKNDLREAQILKQAQELKVDPKLYKETIELKREVEQLKEANRQQEEIQRASEFKNAVISAVNEYNLGENGQSLIFERLEAAGIGVDTLLAVANPRILIDGVLADTIKKTSVQAELSNQEKLNKVSGRKLNDNLGEEKKKTLDDLIKSEIEDYKKSYF